MTYPDPDRAYGGSERRGDGWIRFRRNGRLRTFLGACWARLRRKETREEDEMAKAIPEPFFGPLTGTFEHRIRQVCDAVHEAYTTFGAAEKWEVSVLATTESGVLVARDGAYWRVPYTVDADGGVELLLDRKEEVKVTSTVVALQRAELGKALEDFGKGLPTAAQVHVQKPYDALADLPDAVRKLPTGAQRIYRGAFNAAYEEYGEERAHKIAWAAVKNKYEQRGGRWVAKAADPWIRLPPIIRIDWVAFGKSGEVDNWYVPILKADDEKRIVYGVVLEPGDPEHPDAQGDWVRPEEIEAAAQDFMKRYGKQRAKVGLQHREEAAVDIVESSILQQDTQYNGAGAKAGSWVLGVYVRDEDVWQAVKAGELTGFSIGGSGERVEAA